jgi:hypothetical protein
MKSLQSASMIVGRFMKAKSLKKSDDEILAGFGAEKNGSDDELDAILNEIKNVEETPRHSTTAASFKTPKSSVGKMFGKLAKKQISIESGATTPFGVIAGAGGHTWLI